MFIALTVLLFFVCAGLIFLILIQRGESAGLSDAFGGGGSQRTIFGARSSTFMARATSVLGAAFLLICLLMAIISARRTGSLMDQTAPPQGKITETESVIPPVAEETEEEPAE